VRLTRLVATIGPASIGRIPELAEAGMDVARINLSHGDEAGHRSAADALRTAAANAGLHLALLADLPGPKVRLGELDGGEIDLEAGASFALRPGGSAGDASGAATTHAGLASDLRPGDRVLLADGAVELRVDGASGGIVRTTVERGGSVRSGAGVSVPSERLSLPALTARDLGLLDLVRELDVDYVGQSFVRSAADVGMLRRLLGEHGPRIVAKIETRPGVERVDEILAVADAIMVARGDLGVEIPFEEVPLVQKRLVRAAVSAERPVIVATQMLESMVSAPRPTRAEASDVANAALDGADAVMLSAETAIGTFPVLAAEAAVRIVTAADELPAADRVFATPLPALAGATTDDARAVALAAVALAAADPDVRWITCFTRTGHTARTLAALRPGVPILAVTPDESVARALALHRGVGAATAPGVEGADAIGRVLRAALVARPSSAGAAAVLVASTAGGSSGPNLVEVVRLS